MDDPELQEDSVVNGVDPSEKPSSKVQGRKRTKTGCLTCRRRRIKCGEERPTCQNCIKSKRQCEGYNQRVVFKDPVLSMTSLSSSSSKSGSSHAQNGESLPRNVPGQKPIAPRPPVLPESRTNAIEVSSTPSATQPIESQAQIRQSMPSSAAHRESVSADPYYAPNLMTPIPSIPSSHQYANRRTYDSSASTHNAGIMPTANTARAVTRPVGYGTAQNSTTSGRRSSFLTRVSFGAQHVQAGWNESQPWPLDRNQMNEDDDDPFDVSEEDIEMGESREAGGLQEQMHLNDNDLGIAVALQASQDNRGLSIRSFTSFIDRPDMLATYLPSAQSTPLKDPITARIFCHFVNVTGPSMSMFERHPANPSLIFLGQPVPESQQHIWTYTFPSLALQSPALLHAILAISSLHIAKLQNTHVTASYKHYALSLRRLGKAVSLPTRRSQPATLAASLLLAFYECMAADHQKWSNHLLGARQLVREIDFAGVTRYMKRRTREERRRQSIDEGKSRCGRLQPRIDEVDEGIVGILMGKRIRYDPFGEIVDEEAPTPDQNNKYSKRQIDTFETQLDLFWWYCKQDTYQSILGGGRMFLDYSLFSHCPPRAPIGCLNAVYGTFDHVILLMARLANFAAKDLKRKRHTIKMNGGRWQPPESMRTPPQDTQRRGSTPPTPNPPPIPPFSGMVPGVKEATLPMGFEPSGDSSPESSTHSDDIDLQIQTKEAEEEWQDIRNGFTVIESHLGEDFLPLGPEFSSPIPTPFGPALQYRTFGIAGVWMNFYMALITCYRVHPSMPPAAMMAAGITARETAFAANQLGRIAAGIAPDCSIAAAVNPSLGAALIESCTCLFVSGVQYQSQEQRSWTIYRLRDIARLTGWQTALAIANGCEATWTKTGELGRGPSYTRIKGVRDGTGLINDLRRIDRALDGKTSKESRLVIERSDRVHYAMGVLSFEEDFEKLHLDGDEGS